MRDFIRQTCLQKPTDIRPFAASSCLTCLVSDRTFRISFFSDYFTHPMLEKRIDDLLHQQNESVNVDIKVISEEIFQR